MLQRSQILNGAIGYCSCAQWNGETQPVVYLYVTWVKQNHNCGGIWQNIENTGGLKIPIGKGSCVIVCHNGSPSFGFIKDSKLIFRCSSGSNKDYHLS